MLIFARSLELRSSPSHSVDTRVAKFMPGGLPWLANLLLCWRGALQPNKRLDKTAWQFEGSQPLRGGPNIAAQYFVQSTLLSSRKSDESDPRLVRLQLEERREALEVRFANK
jgi:hypothetical protein